MNRVPIVPALPPSPLAGIDAVELGPADEPRLQRFFEANPDYFLAVDAAPPGPTAARDEIRDEVPAGMSHGRHWLLGWTGADGELVAMADGVCDLLAPTVWHIGLFIVATARHGSGDAQALVASLEDWARAGGARWMRLGVVAGNARAERFWARQGYVQTRTREVAMDARTNTVRVLHKPLAGGSVEQYLTLVPRDRPGG